MLEAVLDGGAGSVVVSKICFHRLNASATGVGPGFSLF